MKKTILLLMMALSVVACTKDSDKGDGENSYLCGDFVDAHAGNNLKIDYVETDRNERFYVSAPFTRSSIKKSDSFYRGVFYYKRKNNEEVVEPVSFMEVGVAGVIPIDTLTKKKPMKTDPLYLEAMWVGKNMKYLNAELSLKVGTSENKSAVHNIAVIGDSIVKHADNTKTLYLRLYHDQGGVPEYYSQRAFLSVPLQKLGVDSIHFEVNTYDGIVRKTLFVKQ